MTLKAQRTSNWRRLKQADGQLEKEKLQFHRNNSLVYGDVRRPQAAKQMCVREELRYQFSTAIY